MTRPGQQVRPEDPVRRRWFWQRLALMAVDAVGLLVALALARPQPTAAVAVAAVAAAAICAAALLDLRQLLRRRRRVITGVEQAPLLDPLDSWINVAGLAALTVIPAGVSGAPAGLRALVITLAAGAVLISWAGQRRHGWRRLQAEMRARRAAAEERR
ncbi:hypothetical protein [Nocardioides pantholopis]|uniref:hypothetical protein n=1 Tax=Nocardioides pantholopis TaxID=2483798 RepID=UPI000F087EDA|nr:hypothetical protein [Nocardioides pantholopis]